MSRKPFLPMHAGKTWGLGCGVAAQRPTLLALIGDAVARWPFVEHNMAIALGLLLKANTDASLAMFSSLRNYRAQQDAILAAAEVTLEEDDFLLIRAVLEFVRSTQKLRDALAHGHWGVCDTLPNSLLWVDGKHHSPWNAEVLLRERGAGPTHDDLAKHFFVYDQSDLEEVVQQIDLAWRTLLDLVVFLRERGRDDKIDSENRKRILQSPQIVEVNSRLAQSGAARFAAPVKN